MQEDNKAVENVDNDFDTEFDNMSESQQILAVLDFIVWKLDLLDDEVKDLVDTMKLQYKARKTS